MGALTLGVERLLEGDVAWGQPAVGHRAAHRRRPVLQAARDVGADPPDRVGGEPVALLGIEVLDRLEQPVVALLHEILEPHSAAHELAGHRDDEAEVVDDEQFLGALLALARPPRHLQFGVAVERRVGPDQLDQGREVIELASVAHRDSLQTSTARTALASDCQPMDPAAYSSGHLSIDHPARFVEFKSRAERLRVRCPSRRLHNSAFRHATLDAAGALVVHHGECPPAALGLPAVKR